MVAGRLVLMTVAAAIAAYWAHDYIETGAPSAPAATALLVCGVAIAALAALGARKKGEE